MWKSSAIKGFEKIVILNRLNNLVSIICLTLFPNQPNIKNYYAMCLLLLFDMQGKFNTALSYLIKIIAGLDKYLSAQIFLNVY